MSSPSDMSRRWQPIAGRLVALAVLLLPLVALPVLAQEKSASAGEMLYRNGMLASGQPLVGEREAGINVRGAAAACANCHRRSGFGMSEGAIVVPPISGTYLFRPRGRQIEDMDLRYVTGYGFSREAHSDETLARAIREGVSPKGRTFSYLMPRFKIDDDTMASLIAYLKGLSKPPYPGVTEDTLHFATVITPDADPARAKAMLDVMNRFFADKNEFIRGGVRPLRSTNSGVAFRVTRRWQLHVWELSGEPQTWEEQLKKRLAAEPVLAVISGLGGATWEPVHRFCEHQALPCLLPNVDLPVVAESDFYSVYFSKGVLLETQLVAKEIEHSHKGVRRLVQVYRERDIGEPAAKALSAESGLRSINRVLKASAQSGDVAAALKEARAGDALMLWLRPEDLATLPAEPPKGAAVFMSGLMGSLENAPLPAAWRGVTLMAYPAGLPEERKFRMTFPLTWFKIRQIPVVDERLQSDTYVACGMVAEMSAEMLDSFSRDYLLERFEDMMSRRKVNGYYPRVGLAQGQRFASKGGYIARFSGPAGPRVVAEGSWINP